MMKLPEKLLLMIVSAGVMGLAHAGAVDQSIGLDTCARTAFEHRHPFPLLRDSARYSFADIVNFTAGAENRTVVADSIGSAVVDGTTGYFMHFVDPRLAPFSGSGPSNFLLDTVSLLDAVAVNLSPVVVPDESRARMSGKAHQRWDSGTQLSVGATPEPADWMTLLCGFAVVTFMARRKTSSIAG